MITDPQPLQEWIAGQRWFGGRERSIAGVRILDEGIIDDGPPAFVLVLVSLDYADGGHALYQLPLLVAPDGSSTDISADIRRAAVIGDLMIHSTTIKGSKGNFQFGGPGLDPLARPPGTASIRVVESEQSNTSVIFDEDIILKFFRRLEEGSNPDLELNRVLTGRGFDHIPAQVGEIVYEGEVEGRETSIDLGLAQLLVPDAKGGWAQTLDYLHRFLDEVHDADAPEDRAFLTNERAGDLLDAIGALGDATASLHVTLAREEAEEVLAPETISAADLHAWSDQISAATKRLAASSFDKALAGLEDEAQARVERLRGIADPGTKTRVHGDYHLGQVLLGPRGWMILDFEGEPLRPLEDRRAKQSPLRDVAGMLRSLNYAAVVALFDRTEPGSDEWLRLEPWATRWEIEARERFLTAYLTRAHEGRFLPSEREEMVVMLEAFEIEKAAYELDYERGHRPGWVRIPLYGIARICGRGMGA